MSEVQVPVWLDCDPGHDDAFAILLACYHPKIRILGVSSVFGNADLDKTAYNATSILTAIGKHKEVEVFMGARKALVRPPLHAADIHGRSGLDGTELLPKPLMQPNTSVPAIDAMAAALKREQPGTAWVVATGSLTNVAMLFQTYPELVAHIKGLSIMGGAIGAHFTDAVTGKVNGVDRIGNWSQFAEFNIVVDPEAAASIFDNKPLAAKTTLIPLDVTHLVLATQEVQDMLRYGPGGQKTGDGKSTMRVMLVELLTFFAQTYKDVFGITEGPPLHDPLAVAAVLMGLGKHEIPFYDFDSRQGAGAQQRERYDMKVITEGTHEEAIAGAQTGRTVAKLLEPGSEGVFIPRGLDIPLFWKVIEECCERADEANAKLAASA